MAKHSRTGNMRDPLAPPDLKEQGEGIAVPKAAKMWSFRNSKSINTPTFPPSHSFHDSEGLKKNQKPEGKGFR